MISIKSEKELNYMREAGKIVGETHNHLVKFLKEGVKTITLDQEAEKFIKSKGGTPSFKNYQGYPNSICTSINEEVVHGIPSNRELKNGDIISIDIGVCYQGYHGDSAWTYPIGEIDDKNKHLLKYTELALVEGLKQIKPGNKIKDISQAIEKIAKQNNLSIVRELVGHGIGNQLHEEPQIPNYVTNELSPTLKEGMTIAVEPMLNLGEKEIVIKDDGWTIVTKDNKNSAHFEHTVVVTKDGMEILTKR